MLWGECGWGALLLGMASQPVYDTPSPPRQSQSFGRIKKWLEHARSSPSLTILAGGKCDDSVGYFVEPCIVESKDPQEPIMKEVSRAGSLGRREQSLRRAEHAQDPGMWLLVVLLHFTDGSVRSQKGSVSLLVRAEPGLEVRPPDPKSRALSLTLLSLAMSQHFHCPWPLRPLSPS